MKKVWKGVRSDLSRGLWHLYLWPFEWTPVPEAQTLMIGVMLAVVTVAGVQALFIGVVQANALAALLTLNVPAGWASLGAVMILYQVIGFYGLERVAEDGDREAAFMFFLVCCSTVFFTVLVLLGYALGFF